MPDYHAKIEVPVSAEQLYAWHESKGALHRLMPPWQRMEVTRRDPELAVGSEVHFQAKAGPFSMRWVARHTEVSPPECFVDEQIKGPFRKWVHRHRMLPVDDTQSVMDDHVTYDAFGPITRRRITRELERVFRYRHDVLRTDLLVQTAFPSKPLKVAISGASGMLGRALTAFLQTAGHSVFPIVRKKAADGEIFWDPDSESIDEKGLEGMDAVIHLAGENIGEGRWTASKKKKIRQSRVKGTRCLVAALNRLDAPPAVFISASAVGIYGSEPGQPKTEVELSGSDFLASVCMEWETEAQKYEKGRCVIPRFGVILSSQGGALAKMLLPFRLGLGGVLGDGHQHMSWISLDDAVYAVYALLVKERYRGPVNVCTHKPATNYELTKTLGAILRRPTVMAVPRSLARLAFGEMADATLLADCSAVPQVLESERHPFYYDTLEKALRHLLGRID